jgi:trk system potassium uptake protein TrkH
MGKLIYPHSVGGAGRLGRRIRREGAYIAWIFFMLFILTLAAVMLALAATGLDFEEALILAVAALSTTGRWPRWPGRRRSATSRSAIRQRSSWHGA